MFQQHQGESLSEAWTRFKDLLQKAPHHGIDLWLQVQILYDHVNPATKRTIDQSAGVVPMTLNTVWEIPIGSQEAKEGFVGKEAKKTEKRDDGIRENEYESGCGQTFFGYVANRPPTWNDSSPWFMYTAVLSYDLAIQQFPPKIIIFICLDKLQMMILRSSLEVILLEFPVSFDDDESFQIRKSYNHIN
ncbi:hypothetical protein Tco_0826101 [Tanacetum coccineum]